MQSSRCLQGSSLADRRHRTPPQAGVEPSVAEPLLNAFQARVTVELRARQPVLPERLVQFLDSTAHGPFGAEPGQVTPDLFAVDPVAARIGSAALHVPDPAALDDLLHDRGDVSDLVVLLAAADVEG